MREQTAIPHESQPAVVLISSHWKDTNTSGPLGGWVGFHASPP